MLGNIQRILKNRFGSVSFGFILGEDGNDYFFHKSSLKNCTIYQLEEGDSVEFEEEFDSGKENYFTNSVRKRFSSITDASQPIVNPGINPSVHFLDKNQDELKIINSLQKVFYITHAGRKFKINDSEYNYVFAKPTETFRVLFNLRREFVIVFSDFVSFEPRSLDVASKIIDSCPSTFRLDRGIQILISNDSNIEKKITALFQSKDTNFESIVIPFSYREFISGTITEDSIKDRFRKFLFDVDLFAINSPIQNDTFFFGRRDYVRDIASKCKTSTHCGIFGLRRSGKTSCLLAIKRLLEQEKHRVLFIPCQSDLKTTNWKNALFYISRGIQQLTKTNIDKLHSETDYRRNSANISFEEDIVLCLKGQNTPITIMFDEIEAITFDVETSGENWKSGESYLHFWDILRGFCSKYPQKLSIVIAGTNPMINELPTITSTNNRNPMCGQLSTSNQGAYLPPFDVNSTEAMVNTLGGYMGLQFSKEICGRLSSDCGGHPYLIRLFCSCINKYIKDNDISRPVIVTKAIYEKATPLFEKSGEAEAFFLMVLNILQSCYEKEYNALKILATSGDEQISQTLDNKDLQHLLGYGLIENNAGRYAIRFDTIERFLQGKYKFERQGLSISEQKEEINLRFDNAERKLRTIVRDTLRQALGTEIGKETVINAMRLNSAVTQKMIDVATTLQFKQLFDSTLNKGMFFTTLIKIIGENYSLFSNVFSANKSDVINHLNVLNQSRTLPGHSAPENAENWKTSDFEKFRTSMQWCEKIMSEFD